MWEVAQYQIRAHLLAQRRKRLAAQIQAETGSSPRFRFRKAEAVMLPLESQELGTPQGPVDASVFLHEIQADSIQLFASEAICIGQRVALSVTSPHGLYLCGVVTEVVRVGQGRVISAQPRHYRITIRPEFDSASEQFVVEEYCRDFLPRLYLDERSA